MQKAGFGRLFFMDFVLCVGGRLTVFQAVKIRKGSFCPYENDCA